jgi:hypothetical protein
VPSEAGKSRFEAAAERSQPSSLRQLGRFLVHNKKWWMIPMLLVIALVGALLLTSGTVVAPFVYTLF